MRARIVAAGASLFTLGSLVWPSTAVAHYEVCNKTDTDVYVAYGFINPAGGGWATKGWRRVDANGECELLVKSGWTSDPHHYWAYAEEVGGGREWVEPVLHNEQLVWNRRPAERRQLVR